MCCRRFFAYVKLLYEQDLEVEFIATYSSVQDAQKQVLQLLLQYATEAGLTPHFHNGPSYNVPCALVFIKHKRKDWLSELKCRILLSHFHRPLKRYGRLIGWALTVFIKAVVEVFDTWAILNTRKVREYAHCIQCTRASLFLHGSPNGRPRKLYELDVRQLFQRLSRDGVLEAVTGLSEELTRFLC